MKPLMRATLCATFAGVLTVAAACPVTTQAASLTTLYSFAGPPDGSVPASSLLRDAAGNLYGTTQAGGALGFGTVYRLSPPRAGSTAWTETLIYEFAGGNDGAKPLAAVIADATGALYGTTSAGGPADAGTVYKLTPPAKGGTKWTHTILYAFSGGNDGATPYSPLLLDKSGAFIGTTSRGGLFTLGTVFKLTPPKTTGKPWNESVLYSFTGVLDGALPASGVVTDATGAYYGTAAAAGQAGYGIVYRLTPPRFTFLPWNQTTLYGFAGGSAGAYPAGGVVFDKAGALYGATAQGGAANAGLVYRLTPPAQKGGNWGYSALYEFGGGADGAFPASSLLVNPSTGAVTGTTTRGGAVGSGTVFSLRKPAANTLPWTATQLADFSAPGSGNGPATAVIQDSAGRILGTTSAGGASGFGTVYQITP